MSEQQMSRGPHAYLPAEVSRWADKHPEVQCAMVIDQPSAYFAHPLRCPEPADEECISCGAAVCAEHAYSADDGYTGEGAWLCPICAKAECGRAGAPVPWRAAPA